MFAKAQDVASWHSVPFFHMLMVWLPEKAEIIQANAIEPIILHTVRWVTVSLLLMPVNPGHTGINLHQSKCEAGRSVLYKCKQVITSFYVSFSAHFFWGGFPKMCKFERMWFVRHLSGIVSSTCSFIVASPCNDDLHLRFTSLHCFQSALY